MKRFFYIINKGGTPVINIIGEIGQDADFAAFRAALGEIIDAGHKRCRMVINSCGGSMTEGFAMFDMLKASGMVIEVEIVGMAASMAAVLSQVASPGMLGIHSNAAVMTHKAQTGAGGESDFLRAAADFADKLEAKAKKIFQNRTGLSDDEMKDWFQPGAMKWFNAEEAVTAGLADYIIQDATMAQRPANGFKSASEAFKFYNSFTPEFSTNNDTMKKPILTVLNMFKVVHTLNEQSTDEQFASVVENALKDRDAQIKTLSDAAEAANKDKAAALVENAIKDGKIKAEMKDKYVVMATANYETVKDMFDGLQGRVDPKQVIVQTAAGSGKGAENKSEDKKDKPAKKYSEHTEKELTAMKSTDFEGFKQLFKDEFKADYEG